MGTACTAFWHGAPPGPIERACMRSVVRHGNGLALYSYRDIPDLPAGVELRDAATILPEDRMIRHSGGSPAPFADWFRYSLQQHGAGTWIDLDIYFVAPLEHRGDYLFGLQEPGVINNAVLRLPPDSPLVLALIDLFEHERPLPWLSLRERTLDRWNRIFAPAKRRERLPWGATAPRALTALAYKLDVAHWAVPAEVFYPVTYHRADWILDPALRLEDMIGPQTVAVHLWNELIRPFKQGPAPRGSFLERLLDEGAH